MERTILSRDIDSKKWLDYYCQYFSTLELNVTFYRFPELSFMELWYNRSPADFCFSVKVPKMITHYQKFNNITATLNEFYTVIHKGLADKLGPVLFQLLPQFDYTPERLQQILLNMDTNFENVIEFRNSSWWCKEVMDQLTHQNISFCGVNFPELPREPVVNTLVVYYRFHGVPKLYYSPYSKTELANVADAIKQQFKLVKKNLFVFQ